MGFVLRSASYAMAKRKQLKPGEAAPNFTLTDQTGQPWELFTALKNGPVVLFFYPKDDTPVCIAEACSFRDRHEVFLSRGAQIVGVSSDSVESHRSFANRHDLPYTLLSDLGGNVRALFGVKKTLGFFDGRVTFVIDPAGIVRHAYSAQFAAEGHVKEALQTLESFTSTA